MTRSVYETLLERIILGDIHPGTSLSDKDIAAELQVSRTPVREALLQLKHEGLVRIISRGGIFVAQATIQSIRDVTEVRLVLEECAGRLAIERCGETLLEEFKDWVKEQERCWPDLSPRERMIRDLRFHHFMDQASGNEALVRQIQILRHQSILFWGQSITGQYPLEILVEDFRAVVDAIAARNTKACVDALQQHVIKHIERIQSFIKPEVVKLTSPSLV